MNKHSIGIVGGVGPYAGLELQKAILRHTPANRDQDYLPVISISAPHEIADRTDFILGITAVNPAYEIIDQIKTLYAAGARYIGIPCNTAHADTIFPVIRDGVSELNDIHLVNMIDEMFYSIKDKKPASCITGVLATKGSYKSRLFETYGTRHQFEVVIPDDEQLRDEVHRSIYNESYGIKVLGYLHRSTRENIDRVFQYFKRKNINTVILGCTELSVVFTEEEYKNVSLIDPIDALARKLVSLYKSGIIEK